MGGKREPNVRDLDHRRQEFAKQARMARAGLRLTQNEVADLAGVVRSTYRALESGDGNSTLISLMAIADALQLPLSRLLGDPPDRIDGRGSAG